MGKLGVCGRVPQRDNSSTERFAMHKHFTTFLDGESAPSGPSCPCLRAPMEMNVTRLLKTRIVKYADVEAGALVISYNRAKYILYTSVATRQQLSTTQPALSCLSSASYDKHFTEHMHERNATTTSTDLYMRDHCNALVGLLEADSIILAFFSCSSHFFLVFFHKMASLLSLCLFWQPAT